MMKYTRFASVIISIFVLALTVSACGNSAENAPADDGILRVGDGTTEKQYTVEDLKTLAATESSFGNVAYLGVSVNVLLQDAGFDPQEIKALKVVASDGFTVNYSPDMILPDNVLVAYVQSNGPLTADDGTFRMVLPDQEGNMNPRMLVSMQVVQ